MQLQSTLLGRSQGLGCSPTRQSPARRVAARKPTHRVHAQQYDNSARQEFQDEVKRLIDKAEYTSRTQQDGLTKVLIGASLPILKLLANAPAPAPPSSYDGRDDYSASSYSGDAPRGDDSWRSSSNGNGSNGDSWRSSSSGGYSSSYSDSPRSSFGGSSGFGGGFGSGFGGGFGGVTRSSAPASLRSPREDNPQVSAVIKLLRSIGIGFAVSLFFGTIPFLDLLQFPEKGGALGWAVCTAAYLWAMLAMLRFGKLSIDQPYAVLPDNTELAAESIGSNTASVATFSLLNAAADGLLYRGALLTSVAVWGDVLVSGDAAYSNMTSPTTIILLTAAIETAVRVLTSRNDARVGPADQALSCVFHFVMVAFLASETLSTGSLLGSIGTQALGFGLAATAARQGWMEIPDIQR